MATVADPMQDQEEQQGQPGQPDTVVSAPGPMQQAAPTTGATTNFAGAAKKPKGSGRFTNLQKYIQANKQAGQQIAGQLGQSYQKQAEVSEKQANLQGRGQQIGQAIGSEQQRLARTPAEQYTQQIGQMGGAQQIAQDPNELRRFTQLRTGQSLADPLQQQAGSLLQDYSSQIGQLRQQQQALGTEGGRFQALQQAFGNPQYSQGQRKLDQLFLQAGGQGGLQGLQAQIGEDVQARQQAARQLANQYGQDISGIRGQAGDIGKQLTDFLGKEEDYSGIIGQTRKEFEDNLEQIKKRDPELYNSLQEQLQSGRVSSDLASQIKGLEGLSGKLRTYGLDPSAFMIAPTTPTLSQSLSPEQFKRYQALSQLAGVDPTISGQGVGEYQGNPLFDQERFLQERQAREDRFRNDFTQGLADIMSLQNWSRNYGIKNPLQLSSEDDFYTVRDKMDQHLKNITGGTRDLNWAYNSMTYDPLTQFMKSFEQQRNPFAEFEVEDPTLEQMPQVT